MFQFAKGKDQRVEALAPVRELMVEGGHHCHMDDAIAATIYSAWQSFSSKRSLTLLVLLHSEW